MGAGSESSLEALDRLKSLDAAGLELLPDRQEIGCTHVIGEDVSDCPVHGNRKTSATSRGVLPDSSINRPPIANQTSPLADSAGGLPALRIPAGLRRSLNFPNTTEDNPYFCLSTEPEGRCQEYVPENVRGDVVSVPTPINRFVAQQQTHAATVSPIQQMRIAYKRAFLVSRLPTMAVHQSGRAQSSIAPAPGSATDFGIAFQPGPPPLNMTVGREASGTSDGAATTERFSRQRGAARVISRGTARGGGRASSRRTARGSSRGAARGNARTAVRASAINTVSSRARNADATSGWRVEEEKKASVISESSFDNNYITQRVRLFVLSAIQRLKLELEVKNLTTSRVDVVILFMDEVIRSCRQWLEEYVRMKDIEGIDVSLADMYRYLAVLLYGHCTGFSMKKVITSLQDDGGWKLNKTLSIFIHNNLLAFAPTGRGDGTAFTWNPQRDRSTHLGEFERKAYRMSSRVYLNPNHTFCTLDDDLMGTRAEDNPLVTISARKADKQGHSMTAIADAIFRVFLHARFRRRGEPRKVAVSKLLSDLLESRGERCLQGIVLTYDRGYASEAMVTSIVERGVACMCIMNDRYVGSHPFAGKSFFSLDHFDESDEECDNPAGIQESLRSPFDRHHSFIIDDYPNAGLGSYRAVKSLGRGQNAHRLTATAVRHYGSKQRSNIVRFMHAVQSPVQECLSHWVAVPHTWRLERHLYDYKNEEDRISIPAQLQAQPTLKARVELMLLDYIRVLTVAQRCADWFTLREFRLTSTSAASILLKHNEYRDFVGLPVSLESPPSPPQLLEQLSKSWFSSNRSTEEMLRGTVNEDAVLLFFENQEYIKAVYKAGMFCRKSQAWVASCVDAIAIFDSEITRELEERDDGEREFYISVMEIKTVVGSHSVERGSQFASADLLVCDMRSSEFKERIPKEHVAQLVHHCFTVDASFFFYVCATESQVLYTVLSMIPTGLLTVVYDIYESVVTPALKWAHEDVYDEAARTENDEVNKVLQSRLQFWRLINDEVKEGGPFVPVQIFKHGSQTIYNKTKGGVDGNAQMRAILRCPTDTLKWEQKLVTQVFKTLVVNSWVAWRQLQKQDMLRTKEDFKGLDQYRNALNKTESMADFIFELTTELLSYAEALEKQDEITEVVTQRVLEPRLKRPEITRIIAKAKGRKRYRLNFFNSPDGVTLRLHIKGHDHYSGSDYYCALCGNNKTRKNQRGFRGHRSRHVCRKCSVHLCIKTPTGYRRSCWDVWHSSKQLKSRQPPPVDAPQPDVMVVGDDNDNDNGVMITRSMGGRAENRS